MSKIAVISDIHANKDGLKLVLKDIEKKGIDKIICLGDLVTKYFYPAEVVDAVRKNCFIFIKGNCDELVVENNNYKFARSKLGVDRIDFLDNMPYYGYLKLNNIDVNLYHSSPNGIDKLFNPLFDGNKYTSYKDKIIKDYNEMFPNSDNQISIVGHTHQNYIGLEINNKLNLIDNECSIFTCDRAILNVGSAGEHIHMILQNKKTSTIIDSYLTYLVLDTKKQNQIDVKIIKVPYRDVLKKVYFDSLYLQNNNLVPKAPNDTKKLEKSLKLM